MAVNPFTSIIQKEVRVLDGHLTPSVSFEDSMTKQLVALRYALLLGRSKPEPVLAAYLHLAHHNEAAAKKALSAWVIKVDPFTQEQLFTLKSLQTGAGVWGTKQQPYRKSIDLVRLHTDNDLPVLAPRSHFKRLVDDLTVCAKEQTKVPTTCVFCEGAQLRLKQLSRDSYCAHCMSCGCVMRVSSTTAVAYLKAEQEKQAAAMRPAAETTDKTRDLLDKVKQLRESAFATMTFSDSTTTTEERPQTTATRRSRS